MRTITLSRRSSGSIAALLLILFFILPNAASAQKKYKTFGRKCVAMTLADPGEMYSTYKFSEEEGEKLTAAGMPETMMSDISDHYNEGSWPSAMNNLDSRLENTETIRMYKVFKVTEWDGKCLLVIPAKPNTKMPEGFKPVQDFYMVINVGGVK
jgi:hypothetical protein